MRLRELRLKSHLTQKDVADKMNVDKTTVTKWETGAAYPRADKLPLLASLLGCCIQDLYDRG